MKRLIAASPFVVLVAAIALFALYALNRPTAQVTPRAMVGRPVPAIALGGLDGEAPQSLNAVARGPVLVNLFASWCAPCAVEHPELMRLKDEGVPVVGVAYKDRPADSRAFLERLGNPFSTLLNDPKGMAGIELGVTGVPETFAIDARGVIVAKHASPLTRADAERLVAAMRGAG